VSYAKRFNPEKYRAIQDLIDRMLELKPGRVLEVTRLRGEAGRVRSLLYDYLSSSGNKAYYRIFWKKEKDQLTIHRMVDRMEFEIKVREEQPAQYLQDKLRELIGVPEEALAEETISHLLKEEKISVKEAGWLLSEWKRIMN